MICLWMVTTAAHKVKALFLCFNFIWFYFNCWIFAWKKFRLLVAIYLLHVIIFAFLIVNIFNFIFKFPDGMRYFKILNQANISFSWKLFAERCRHSFWLMIKWVFICFWFLICLLTFLQIIGSQLWWCFLLGLFASFY